MNGVNTFDKVLYRYQRRNIEDKKSLFEILYGVQPHFSGEKIVNAVNWSTMHTARIFKLTFYFPSRGERLVRRIIPKSEPRFRIIEKALLRRSDQPSGPKIENRLWVGPYTVISSNYLHNKLENVPSLFIYAAKDCKLSVRWTTKFVSVTWTDVKIILIPLLYRAWCREKMIMSFKKR